MPKYNHHNRYLTLRQCDRIWSCHNDYVAKGRTPIKHITIDWAKVLDNPDMDIQYHVSRFMNQMRKWHRYHNSPFAYIWIIENTSDQVGLHVHIVLYSDINVFDDLNAMITRWLPFERDDLENHNVGGTNIKITPVNNPDGLIDYLCKGLDCRTETYIAKNRRGRGRQGYVIGKRWSYCRNPITPD